ncbi:LAFA_0E18734g1_1 [Lachancea sp. 'fantastica']|nr:LAFA_0E18734g1_1 [Lachancea sp. 'fantastica']
MITSVFAFGASCWENDLAKPVWLIIRVLLAWTAFQWVIFKLLGVSVGIIDPFRLRLRSLKIQNWLKIKFVYYSLWNHGVVVHGLQLDLPRKKSVKEATKSTQESPKNYFSIPRWAQWLVIHILNLFRRYNFVLEKTELNGVLIDSITVRLEGKGSQIYVSMLMKDAAFGEVASCAGAVIDLTGELNFQRPLLPLEDLTVDLKVRGLSLAYDGLLTLLETRKSDGDDQLGSGSANDREGKRSSSPSDADGLDPSDDPTGCIEHIKSQLLKASDFVAMLKKFNVTAENVVIRDIPLSRHPELIDTARLLTFEVSASNLSFALARLTEKSPGFKLTFQADELPLNVKFTMSSIAFILHQRLETEKDAVRVYHFCEIPSAAIYGDTNILSLRSIEEHYDEPVETVLKLVGHISSPVVDFEIGEFSLLKSFKDNMKVFQSLLNDTADVGPSCAKTIENKEAVFTYFQHILPQLESKITIEDPLVLVSDGCELLVHKCSILSLQTKSDKYALGGNDGKKEMFYKLRNTIEIMDHSFTYHNKVRHLEHRIVTINSISISNFAELVPSIRANFNASVDVCEIDLSEPSTLLTLNNIYRKANCKMLLVEENHFDQLYERFEEYLEARKQESTSQNTFVIDSESCPKAQLFQKLPSPFDGARVNIRGFRITVGARSVFMPSDMTRNLEHQSPEDLVNGELRKMSHSIERVQMSLGSFNDQTCGREDDSSSDGSTLVNSVKAFSYDEFGLDDSASELSSGREFTWLLRCSVSEMVTTLFSERRTDRQTLNAKTVFKLPELSIMTYPDTPTPDKGETGEGRIIFSVNLGSSEMMVSLMTVFLVLSAAHTFKETFTVDVNRHKRESKAKRHLSTQFLEKGQRSFFKRLMKKEVLELFRFECNVSYLSMVLILPNGVKTRMEVFRSGFVCTNVTSLSVHGHFFRLCVESPQVTNYWVRMVTIVDFNMEGGLKDIVNQINDPSIGHDNPAITLSNEMWSFTIPHGFEMYQIFDNISTTAKSIKQMVHALKTSSDECVIYPHISNPIRIPVVNLRSKRWIFSVEDDAFESQLSMIFQVGLKEQRARLEKYALFEEAAAKELTTEQKGMKRAESTYFNTNKKCFHLGYFSRLHKSRRNSSPELAHSQSKGDFHQHEKPDFYKYAENAESWAHKYQKLQENVSTSWIRRIQAFKVKERIEFQKNFEFLWGRVDPEIFPPGINKRIVAFVASPPLMNTIIEDINVTISQPSFGIDYLPDFIHGVGKGIPKDTEYSILFPMHLNAEFRETRCHLRDYPLPFVYLPDLTPRQREAGSDVSIRLHGDVIISEDMIRSDEELRTLFVPLVPSATLENDDKYYSLLVPRTLTAIKTYAKAELELNSDETTLVTWNGSYSPAIQQAMQCFDNFSKPPIDPSPKLGFWDKIREIFHARISVKWKNGQLNVALKGAKSPYMVGGEAAGFIVGLKGGIKVGCNVTDDAKKFLTLGSDEVFFAIPNFFSKPLLAWSRSSKNTLFFPSHENTNLQHYAFFYNLVELPDVKTSDRDIRAMRKGYFEKTAIRLTGGITLNVGMVFERRMPGSEKRTLQSNSHWDARLCNPVFIDNLDAHDSFSGFRSDFIHLSFTLLSSSPKAYNTLQLTAGAFRIFFSWWHSFSGNLPVRRGPLFGMSNMSPKFGVHLFTISYHADIAPLFISHIHTLLDPDTRLKADKNQSIKFVGLKAKTEHFVMDLHQRKEVLHEFKQELNITKRVSKLMFHEGNVSNYDIDVRTVQAEFKNPGFVGQKPEPKFDIFDDDMSWFDSSDFDEVFSDRMEDKIPNLQMHSLVYSPKFVYRKHATYGDKYQVDPETCQKIEPFNNADYHECSLRTMVQSPQELVKNRLKALIKKRDQVQQSIERSLQSKGRHGMSVLEKKRKKIEGAVEQVEQLLHNFQEYEKYDKQSGEQNEKLTPEESSANPGFSPDFGWLTRGSLENSFEHRFFIFSMFLKWNDSVRGAVYSYVHLLDFNRELSFIANHKALRKVNEVIRELSDFETEKRRSVEERSQAESVKNMQNETIKSVDAEEDILSVFEKGLRSLDADFDFITHDNHVVQFIAPQIQLTTSRKPEVCTMITAPSIKLKTIGFDANATQNEYNTDMFMNRYSLVMLKANVFVFHKDSFDYDHDIFFSEDGYDQAGERNWQPWLGLELCFDSSSLGKDAIIRDLSTIFRFDRVFSFANVAGIKEPNFKNKIICQLPRTIISSNSRQYLALYDVIAHLLVYIEPKSAHLRKEVEKLLLSYDTTKLVQLRGVITDLQQTVVALNRLEKELAFRRHILDSDGIDDLKSIRRNKYESLMSLYILMEVLNAGTQEHAAEDQKMIWDLEAKEVIVHLLHDDGTPFLDLALARSFFRRVQSSYGYNNNRIVIGVAQIFNLDRDVLFHNLLSPSDMRGAKSETGSGRDPLMEIEWEIEKPVGGMKVIRNAIASFQSLEINVEQETLTKLLQWAFPAEMEEYIQAENKSGSAASETDEDGASTYSEPVSETIDSIGNERQLAQNGPQEVDEMFKRSSDYMVVDNMVVNSFKLIISYRGSGAKRLINVTDFGFLFPRLTLHNRTLKTVELVMVIKQVLLKALLKHAGKFLGNKLKRHSLHIEAAKSPLRQLSTYQSYTKVEDLTYEKGSEELNHTKARQHHGLGDPRKSSSKAFQGRTQHSNTTHHEEQQVHQERGHRSQDGSVRDLQHETDSTRSVESGSRTGADNPAPGSKGNPCGDTKLGQDEEKKGFETSSAHDIKSNSSDESQYQSSLSK